MHAHTHTRTQSQKHTRVYRLDAVIKQLYYQMPVTPETAVSPSPALPERLKLSHESQLQWRGQRPRTAGLEI